MKNILLSLVTLVFFSCSNTTKTSSNDHFKVVDFPDESKAYLNKNSVVEYDEGFNPRIVTQQGEVFYSVTHGKSSFVVKTKNGEVKVLGTEFNVKSTKEELEVEVEKGSVELKVDKFIKKIEKGQKALFTDVKEGIEIGKAKFKHKKWRKNLKREFKTLSKDVSKGTKKVVKKTKKIGKDLLSKVKK